MFWATLLMALREIRRHTMRSALTTLGVVIGVGAVIAMVTLGEGATAKVTGDVARMGNNMLTVFPGSMRRGGASGAATPFKIEDVEAIAREVSAVRAVAPTSSRPSLVVYGNKNHNSSVTGTTNAFFDIRGYRAVAGRLFSEGELAAGTPACVIGDTVKRELFGGQDPLGASIRVGRTSCVVVGVLEAKGQATFGGDQDDMVLMPLQAFQRRIAGSTDVSGILVSAQSERAITRAKSQIEMLMRERRRLVPGEEADFSVFDMKELSQTLSSVTGALTALLGAIAGVSLLVGGIGIMNIMLVSVTERTREIGIRLAIGARSGEVMLQFLVESAVLSVFGGLLGILLGLGGSYAGTRALSLPFVFSPNIVIVAVTVSAIIGIAFGFLPARKAARLNPIEALRHE